MKGSGQRFTPRLALTLTVLAAGCSPSGDERLARTAENSTRRQAEQNQEMVRLNREVAESHKRLVEADGKARQEVLQLQREMVERDAQERRDLDQLQRDVQAAASDERSRIHHRQEDLDRERRELAAQRGRDPVIAAAITAAGGVLACMVPLVLAIYLLRALHGQGPTEAELTGLLTQELLADRPSLLMQDPAPRAAIEDQSGAALCPPAADESAGAGSLA